MAVLESCAQLCANHYAEGERATLIGQTSDRYPPHVGEVRSAPPEPRGIDSPRKSVVLLSREAGGKLGRQK